MERKHRMLALFMAAVMFFTSIRFVSSLIPTVKAEDQGVVILDDAMHFVIRHWHMTEGGSLSAYVEKFESSTGKLYLNIKVITDDSGEVMEDYTGLSVSSGHSAIEYDGSNIVISYDPYVHLVKAHIFYNPTGKTVRGKVTENPYVYNKDNYINNRLCVFMLSTGMTKLTIEEEDGLSNESFVYHITGTTLGYKEVNLYVSVQGGDSATVIIPSGDYTVEEVSDWSWRYDNKDTYGKYDADDGEKLDEEWKIGKLDENGNIIDADDLTTASTSLRYRDDAEYTDAAGNIVHQTVEEHKTVIYVHKHNEKVWLGGESHKDNHFAVILQQPL